jgi:iduronate 2-sulfatase
MNRFNVAGLVVLLVQATALAADKPNVLFIAVDDLKPTIGSYGDRYAKTPNLDRLAARGLQFDRAYCMQAVCSPSRNAMLTGLRPQTLRIYDLGTNFRKSVPDVVTLPQHFKQQGWRTEALGKLFHVGHGNHEDPASWSVPHYQAKTVQYVRPENKAQLTREEALFENKNVGGANKLPRGAPFESADVPDDTYADGKLADEAINRLKAAKGRPDQPFFLALGFLKPHLPFCAPTKYWDLYDPSKLPMPAQSTPPQGAPEFAPQFGGELRQYADIPSSGPIDEAKARQLIHGYYAATSYMDAQLGRVLDALDELELANNTIVVLWGDHGWHLGDHGMWCKHTNYEQATRAPLIIAAPGKRAGDRTAILTEFVDVYPTLCDLAGIEKPSHLQGESLIALLSGNQDAKSTEGTAFQVYPRSPQGIGSILGQAVRTDRWRYVEWRKPDGSAVARELYDMQNDPDETVNVADDPNHAKVVESHSKLIAGQLAKPHPEGLKMLPVGQTASTAVKPKTDRVALFKRKDKDGDGQLTRDEFLANQPDPDEAPKRFVRFDVDGNGVLSEKEFVTPGP